MQPDNEHYAHDTEEATNAPPQQQIGPVESVALNVYLDQKSLFEAYAQHLEIEAEKIELVYYLIIAFKVMVTPPLSLAQICAEAISASLQVVTMSNEQIDVFVGINHYALKVHSLDED